MAVVRFRFGKGRPHPGKVGGFALAVLRLHLRSVAEIVVAADDMERRKRDATNGPAQVLAELGELLVFTPAIHSEGALPKALAVWVEDAANLSQCFDWINLARLQVNAIRPIVVAGRQDERMPHILERLEQRFTVFVRARHRGRGWRPVIEARISLHVTDMHDESEVTAIDHRKQPRELLLLEVFCCKACRR